jgi:hypothetical protein
LQAVPFLRSLEYHTRKTAYSKFITEFNVAFYYRVSQVTV